MINKKTLKVSIVISALLFVFSAVIKSCHMALPNFLSATVFLLGGLSLFVTFYLIIYFIFKVGKTRRT